MNSQDKHIDTWSMMDVQKYLNGELSAPEMHALEEQALDDPFLADALEGLQTQTLETRSQDLAGLQSRLEIRVAENRTRIIPSFLRVAAVLILLVGVGITGYYTLFYKTKPTTRLIAPVATTSTPPAPKSAAAETPSSPISNGLVANTNRSQEPKSIPIERNHYKAPASTSDLASASEPVSSKLAAAESQPTTAKPPTVAYRATDLADTIAYRLDTDRPAMIASNGNMYSRANMAVKKMSFDRNNYNLVVYSGRVLDFNNRPLAGASLSFKSNKAGAVTDQKGQFSLYLPQKDTARQLTVAMDGYQEAQYALNVDDRTSNTIILHEKPAGLEEVVVSGIGAQRKEVLAAPPSDDPEVVDSLWLNTSPTIGRNTYLHYLDTAKRSLFVDTSIHGTESISFLVDKKGNLTEFRIERSLSPAHDAGLIRLITEGPSWKILRGKSKRALVSLVFP